MSHRRLRLNPACRARRQCEGAWAEEEEGEREGADREASHRGPSYASSTLAPSFQPFPASFLSSSACVSSSLPFR